MQELQKNSVFNNKGLVDEFYSRVQNFLIIVSSNKKKPFFDSAMPAIKLMNPKTTLSIKTRDEYSI